MARPAPTLSVYCNPFASLDHEGRPSGVVLMDPVEHHSYGAATVDSVTGEPRWEPSRYVGATLDAEATTITKRAAAQGRGLSGQADLQDTVWAFSSEPQTVPLTSYYLARIRDGELIPADAQSAAVAGRPFVPYETAIQSARTHALGLWFRARPHHDVPDWATPGDFADLHEDYSSKEHKAAHAAVHAERMKANAPVALPAAPLFATRLSKAPSSDTPASEVK